MPIVYESAAPIALAGGIYSQAARRAAEAQAVASANSGRGGYGGSAVPVLDTGIQDAVNARDRLQFQRESSYLDRDSQAQGRQLQAELATQRDTAEANQQRERFRLQAELQQTELSQQEKMRLQRMKNALGEVANDPSLSDEEKADLSVKLKTGIDPLEGRLAKSRVKAEEQLKNAHVEQYRASAALDNERMRVMASTAADRQRFIPDPQALAAIAEDIKASFEELGPVAASFVNPQMIAKMAEQEAIKQGLGRTAYLKANGDLDFSHEKEQGGGGKAGKPEEQRGARNLTTAEYVKQRSEVEKIIQAQAKATIKDAEGNIKPREVGLQHQDAQEDAVRNMMLKRKLPPDLGEFEATLEDVATVASPGGKKTFDPKNASYRKGQRQTPPPPSGGKTAPPEFRAQDLDTAAGEIMKSQVSTAEKGVADSLLSQAKSIISRYPDPKTRPEGAQKKLDQLAGELDPILRKSKTTNGYVPDAKGPFGVPLNNLPLGEQW